VSDRRPAARKPRRGPGRPRSADIDVRIMASALQLFSLKGWSGFTIEETAKRASIGKATIYLRWQDRADLLIDALHWANRNWPIAQSGCAQTDLFHTLVTMIRRFALPQGWALHCSLLDPALPGDVRACTCTIAEARLSTISQLLAKADGRSTPDCLRATMLVGAAMSFAGAKALSAKPCRPNDARDYAREVLAFYLFAD
jgi:AcrR family transcriptional regulator